MLFAADSSPIRGSSLGWLYLPIQVSSNFVLVIAFRAILSLQPPKRPEVR